MDAVHIVTKRVRGGNGGVRALAVLAGVLAGLLAGVLAGGALLVGCGGPVASAPSSHESGGTESSGTESGGTESGGRESSAQGSSSALADRVCAGARQAAAQAFGSPLSARVVSPAPADLECVLTGRQVRVTVDSQAGPRAYAEFDTETSHQDQVFGNGGVHAPDQFPVQITVPGSRVAVWIPAQMMVVATDSTPDNGGAGAYVTVAVSGRAAPAKTALRVAAAAAGATFAAHPDGLS